jgi:hypothetical protein
MDVFNLGINMKTLKFTKELVSLIISGEKTSTWRLFDDKDLEVGDDLEFINKNTLETFGYAKITEIREKKLGDLVEKDYDGHEKFVSNEEMIETYKGYYGDRVNENTIVKIIRFSFVAVIPAKAGIQS